MNGEIGAINGLCHPPFDRLRANGINQRFPGSCRQAGISLVELVIFIVVVGVGVAGILSVMNVTTAHSADPLIQKQAVAVAESLMDEITLQAFTYCDPTDAKAPTAPSAADCTTTAEASGPEAGESRYSNTTPFNNVNDYAGFSLPSPPGIKAINDSMNPVPGLEGYAAQVAITQVGAAFGLADNTAALRIDVRVTGPANTDITLTGYRFRYAPNAAG